MNRLDLYIRFYRKLHYIKLPKIKFTNINERYKKVYQSEYNIDYNDIYKSNFIIFLIFFSLLPFILMSIKISNPLIILLFSFVLSLIFAYKFNSVIINKIKFEEKQLNAAIYMIKIYFSLILSSLPSKSDYSVCFINMIKDYNLSISYKFKHMLNLIQLGEKPEILLSKIVTPSNDMNRYVNHLLTSDFNPNNFNDKYVEKTLEKKFNIFLKQIDSKLSIIFFISLFLPLALAILIIFQKIILVNIFPILIVYYIILKGLVKKFLKEEFLLIGLLNDYSKDEKEIFNHFISFLTFFALNLKRQISPELAIINSYLSINSEKSNLRLDFEKNISQLLNFSISLEDFIDEIKKKLNSPRYKLILNVLVRLLRIDSFQTSEKIFEILKIISKHQKLERKFEIILKGEKFKVLLYIFLLPVIVGGIGGLFPTFSIVIGDLNENVTILGFSDNLNFAIIFSALLLSVIISSNVFINTLKYKRKKILMLLSIITYGCTFLGAFLTIIRIY